MCFIFVSLFLAIASLQCSKQVRYICQEYMAKYKSYKRRYEKKNRRFKAEVSVLFGMERMELLLFCEGRLVKEFFASMIFEHI